MQKMRIYLTGVGGQGTLTATELLAQAAMGAGISVTSGEIHGMAQRGGVVESTVLLGGWLSPRIGLGEADLLLGFEPLETLRGLPRLRKGALVVSSIDPIMPVSVCMGREPYPDMGKLQEAVESCAGRAVFLPCRAMGLEAGAAASGNMALLGAACALGALPFGLDALKEAIGAHMRPKLVEVNVRAVDLGAAAVA